RDDLLAGAGLAGDEGGEVRPREDGDLVADVLHGRGLTQDLAAAALAQRVADELARDLGLVRGDALQRLDEPGGVHGGRRQRRDGGDDVVGQLGERGRVERVYGEHADHLAADDERAADAGVHRVERVAAGDQAVEGIGQAGVVEADRAAAGEGALEARVLARVEAARRGLGDQPLRRDRHERALL